MTLPEGAHLDLMTSIKQEQLEPFNPQNSATDISTSVLSGILTGRDVGYCTIFKCTKVMSVNFPPQTLINQKVGQKTKKNKNHFYEIELNTGRDIKTAFITL